MLGNRKYTVNSLRNIYDRANLYALIPKMGLSET